MFISIEKKIYLSIYLSMYPSIYLYIYTYIYIYIYIYSQTWLSIKRIRKFVKQTLCFLFYFYCVTHTHTGFSFIYIYKYIYIYIHISESLSMAFKIDISQFDVKIDISQIWRHIYIYMYMYIYIFESLSITFKINISQFYDLSELKQWKWNKTRYFSMRYIQIWRHIYMTSDWKYFNSFQNWHFSVLWLKWTQTMGMKQNQTFFHWKYSNRTSFITGRKILKYFNDLHLSISLQKWVETSYRPANSNGTCAN